MTLPPCLTEKIRLCRLKYTWTRRVGSMFGMLGSLRDDDAVGRVAHGRCPLVLHAHPQLARPVAVASMRRLIGNMLHHAPLDSGRVPGAALRDREQDGVAHFNQLAILVKR